jgi:hypothetical protein
MHIRQYISYLIFTLYSGARAPSFTELLNKLEDISKGLDNTILKDRLETQHWFTEIDANSQKLIEGNNSKQKLIYPMSRLKFKRNISLFLGKARIILKQAEAMIGIYKLNVELTTLKDLLNLSQINTKYSTSIQAIDQVSIQFDHIPKGRFGTFYQSCWYVRIKAI